MLQLLIRLIEVYELIVVLAVLISWIPLGTAHVLNRFPRGVVEPVVRRIRRSIPVTAGAVDFSLFVLILILEVLRQLLVRMEGT